MRGRVIAVPLLSTFLLFTGAAFPQCDYRQQFSGEYRASIFDISIDGNDLWTASGYGVQLYDRAVDPPRLVASVGIPGLTRVVRASNGIAYAAGSIGISVVQRSGRSLKLVRTIPLAVVNDLLLQPGALFAATASGVVEYNLLVPLNPSQTAAKFPTSSPAVTSLALIGSTLYAADGDSSVEAFSIVIPSSPQSSGVLTSLARSSTINAIGTRLYVSDGQGTEVFASSSGSSAVSAGTFPFAATSIADAGFNVAIVAGNDRQLRALDLTVPQNFVELFDDELPPTAGTVNRITSMQTANGLLYVGGGDSGLTTYDISHFASPFPLRAYGIGAASSIVVTPTAMYAGRATTGIQEMTRSSSGALVLARQWSADSETAQDGANGFLLSSTGSSLKFWTVTSTIPTLITTATFRASVTSAYLSGTSTALVLLADGTLWTADLSQTTPVPVAVTTDTGPLAQFAHSDQASAATEINADGTTTLHYWSGNLSASPVNTTIAGVSTALAVGGSMAALFTFRGITVVDASGALTLLPGSNSAVVIALGIANRKAIALTDQSKLGVWDIASSKLEKEIVVPGSAVAIDASQDSAVVGVATSTGVASVNYATPASLPSLIARDGGNAYYRKAAASATRLYLFDGRVIDVFELGATAAPRWLSTISAPGVIDLAAFDTMLFTLSSNQSISEYSSAGGQLRSQPLNEGSDVAPLSIAAVAGAPWVSFSRGCTTTGCEKRTDILDPQSLVRTSSIAGGLVDVTTSGTRAYAIFDLPSEVRVYDVSDALHPSAVTSRANDVNAVAIAYNSGTVYLLADKAYAYSESSLTRTGEQLTALSPSSSADLVIDSGCATITGRSPGAESYTFPQWSATSGVAVPGTIRTMTLSGGRFLILTDYSIEVWSRATVAKNPKRRAAAP